MRRTKAADARLKIMGQIKCREMKSNEGETEEGREDEESSNLRPSEHARPAS
jgi:hypothetical protein